MALETAALVRRWAWVVTAVTLLAVAVGTAAFAVYDHAAVLAFGLAFPWVATTLVGTFGARERAPAWLRAYAISGAIAAVVAFFATNEDLGDRLVFAAISFLVPPAALLYVLQLEVGPTFAYVVLAILGLGGLAAAVVPAFMLRHWANDTASRHRVWLAWAATLLVAIVVAGFAEETMVWPLTLLADAIALVSIPLAWRFAREARPPGA